MAVFSSSWAISERIMMQSCSWEHTVYVKKRSQVRRECLFELLMPGLGME